MSLKLRASKKISEDCSNNLAQIKILSNQFDEAFIYLQEVLKINPANFKALWRKSVCYVNKNLYGEAMEILIKVKEMNLKDTEKEFNERSKLIRKNAEIIFKEGNEHFNNKEYEQAKRKYEKIASLKEYLNNEIFLKNLIDTCIYFYKFKEALNEKVLLQKIQCLGVLLDDKEFKVFLDETKENSKDNEKIQKEIEKCLEYIQIIE